jgi:hypothetical protein
MALSFDVTRFDLTGEPVPIAEAVGSFFATGSYAASANGVLAYRGGGGESIQLTWFDRQGTVLARAGDLGTYNTVGLSQDGTRAAASQTHAGNSDCVRLSRAREPAPHVSSGSGFYAGLVAGRKPHRLRFPARLPSNLYQKASSGAGNEDLRTEFNETIGGMSHPTASVSSSTPRSRRPPRFRSRCSQLDRRVEEMSLAAGPKLGPYEITVPIGPMLSCR